MTSPTLFRGGAPTGPEVDHLIECFGVPAVGTILDYDKIASEIGVDRKKNKSRFYSVMSAYRTRLEIQHNLILRAVNGRGYEVMNNSQRVGFAVKEGSRAMRRFTRAADVALRTDSAGLSTEEIRTRDHIISTTAKVKLCAATAARELSYPISSTPTLLK